MNVTLRIADIKQDAEALFQFEKKCFNRSIDVNFKDFEEFVGYFNSVTVYMAFTDDKLAGFVGYKKEDEKEIEVVALAVFPQYQHKGIAQALFNKILDLEKNKKMKLVTNPENSQAIIFYLKQGFLIKGWKDNYFGNGQPRIILTREVK